MSKQQVTREARYRKQLKRCGFRSWRRANNRRCELIMARVDSDELHRLQILADLYVKWKTNDSMGRQIRWLTRLEKKHGIHNRQQSAGK